MKRGALKDLRWIQTPPPAAPGDLNIADAIEAPAEAEMHPLVRAIFELGAPGPATAMTPHDEAVFLLKVAAEVEHAFIVQYLYAAYSLNESLSATVRGWQGRILQIAKEEMGHLITIQDLLLALRESAYVERENYPFHTDLYPFPLLLEPLSKVSLGKYITAEGPFDEHAPPSSINHVGVLYAKIYWVFQKSDDPQGPWQLPRGIPFPSGQHLADGDFAAAGENLSQAGGEWRGTNRIHVDRITDRDSALAAIALIATQGEGLLDEDQSHFRQFVQLDKEVDDFLLAGNLTFARDVPTNPNTAEQHLDDPAMEKGRITNQTSLRWAKLFNCRYQLLLLDIVLAMSFKRDEVIDGENVRRKLALQWAILERMPSLSTLARLLVTLDKDDAPAPAGSARRAAPPFELTPDPLPTEELARWQLYRGLLDKSAELIDQIAPADADQESLLQDLKDMDSDHRIFVQMRIETLGGT